MINYVTGHEYSGKNYNTLVAAENLNVRSLTHRLLPLQFFFSRDQFKSNDSVWCEGQIYTETVHSPKTRRSF